MKKLLLVLFVLGLALPSFAGLKEKDVIGKWSYAVDAGDEIVKGTLTIEKREGKLSGVVNSDDGNTFNATGIEIKDNNVLYFEVRPDYETFNISLTIDGKKYTGTVSTPDGSFPITGEKVE